MFNERVVDDILGWIESNLESDLSLEAVAQKAGYSKWHFQRIFKQQTGYTLANYVRGRRLSCAAIALRLLPLNLMHLSLKYRFDSQQTFCRAFKQHFGITPSGYRKKHGWHPGGFVLPKRYIDKLHSSLEITMLPQKILTGTSHIYQAASDTWNLNTPVLRQQYWSLFLQRLPVLPDVVYATHGVNKSAGDTFSMCYTTMAETHWLTNTTPQDIVYEPGLVHYLKIIFSGDFSDIDFQDITYDIYNNILSEMSIIRHPDHPDIEKYLLTDKRPEDARTEPKSLIRALHYYIPVILDNPVR
ncbi:AraC family transcriptional regulator [Morganella psychrotolerans]|uniref:AraC family transcriptional regulator n=2 Tax=Morganella psychrotolerans TaxID=368603 RepID=A0A5M9RAX8_9GAMM|nr:AraC family transcriptional regulator [Morganella psychrotolerans]OBU09213.1 Right origin-binding protein [Morganella psychrotolerans]